MSLLTLFGGKKKAPAATNAPEAPYVSMNVPPPGFVPFTRPEGATEEELRDGYTGMILSPDDSCTICFGSGFEPNPEGKIVYCHLRRADDLMKAYSRRGADAEARKDAEATARAAKRT